MSYKNRSPRVNKRGNVEFRKFCISRSFLGLQETLSRFPRPPHSDRRKGENVNFSSFRPSDCDVFIFIRSIRFGFVRPKDFLSALRWGLAGGRREGGTRKGGREEGRRGRSLFLLLWGAFKERTQPPSVLWLCVQYNLSLR